MTYVVFTETGSRIGKPQVSIWARGQIGLNQGAMKRFKLMDFTYAILLYDEDAKKVGIRFTNDEELTGIIKLVKRGSGGVSFSAASFINHYGIEFSGATKFTLTHDKDNELYAFDLNEPIRKTGEGLKNAKT